MTDVTYTYEIIMVDEAARCMEVVYTSKKYGVAHVGVRLPFENETLDQVIAMFAPVQEWRMRDMVVLTPEVGTTGELTDAKSVPLPLKDQMRIMREGAYAQEADPIFFKSQRGEAEIADWKAKVKEIRERFPYPVE